MANLRHATLCVFNGVGHFPFIEAQEQFVKAVTSFLTGAPPGTNGAGDPAADKNT
jgi:pimeloyl-ACP methyl ester carboxylesterase